MADVNILAPIILKWESGFQNSPNDRGNYDNKHNLIGSNKGVTPATYKQAYGIYPTIQMMKELSDYQFIYILKKLFWDDWKADEIKNQSVANILVDWHWASGVWGIMKPQGLLGLKDDGVVGPVTIAKANSQDQETFFNQIKAARIAFAKQIVKDHPNQIQWLHGWENRINSFVFAD